MSETLLAKVIGYEHTKRFRISFEDEEGIVVMDNICAHRNGIGSGQTHRYDFSVMGPKLGPLAYSARYTCPYWELWLHTPIDAWQAIHVEALGDDD